MVAFYMFKPSRKNGVCELQEQSFAEHYSK